MKIRNQIHKLAFLVLLILVVASCKKVEDDGYSIEATSEMAQQIGDTMASIDESGGDATGTVARLLVPNGDEKSFMRLNSKKDFLAKVNGYNFSDLFISKSYAAQCNAVLFSSCIANHRSRDFAGCSIGVGGTITGGISLAFAGSHASVCAIPNAADTVTRIPDYTISGLRGATFKVTAPSPSTGQTITRTGSNAYSFTNNGVNRKFTSPNGTVILDVTTTTSSAINITGDTRSTRVISGSGGITVVDNLTNLSCTLTPTTVAWTGACNCPTSGYWSGSCTDSTTMKIEFSSTCGVATLTKNGVVQTLSMDRCQQ